MVTPLDVSLWYLCSIQDPFIFSPGTGLEYAKKSINKQHDLYHLVHIPAILFVPCVMARCLVSDLALTVSSSPGRTVCLTHLCIGSVLGTSHLAGIQ